MKRNAEPGTVEYDESTVFVEWKSMNPSLRILRRVENLAVLLNLPKGETFQSLTCLGITEVDENVAFIFQYSTQDGLEPHSLLDLFSATTGIAPPSLSARVRLALDIV